MNKQNCISMAVLAFTLLGTTSCASADWEEITLPGSETSFSMPKPVTHRSDQIHDVYQSKAEKFQIQVGVYPRAALQAQPGASDADILREFEENIVKQEQDNLMAGGLTPQLQFESDLGVKDGMGQQMRIRVGDQFVLNQFYITRANLLCVKIDNADKTNPTVARFLDSFNP